MSLPEKLCSDCNQVLPIEEFAYRCGKSVRNGNNRRGYCKKCRNRRIEQKKKSNPNYAEYVRKKSERARKRLRERDPHYFRNRRFVYEYGMTVEDYERMVNRQSGKCAICQKPPAYGILVVDHDHSTGKVRELLCNDCNTALGYVESKYEILKLCEIYSVKHRADSVKRPDHSPTCRCFVCKPPRD